jgi:hypothetical protein
VGAETLVEFAVEFAVEFRELAVRDEGGVLQVPGAAHLDPLDVTVRPVVAAAARIVQRAILPEPAPELVILLCRSWPCGKAFEIFPKALLVVF